MKKNYYKTQDLIDTLTDVELYSKVMKSAVFTYGMKEVKEYLTYREERDRELRLYTSKRSSIPKTKKTKARLPMACEPEPEIWEAKPPTMTFDEIVEYANSLYSPEDVKSIQLMLFKLFGRKCTLEQYDRICAIECKQNRATRIEHADQVIVENKGHVSRCRYGKEE